MLKYIQTYLSRDKKMHEGHRERLYTRFLECDPTLTDVETVELLLCYSIARMDVKPIAKELIDIYGSVRGVIEAPAAALMHVKGMGKKSVVLFKIFGKIMNDAMNKETYYTISNIQDAAAFFRTMFVGLKTEKFAMLLLAKDGKVLDRTLYSQNLQTEVNINLSEIMLKVCELSPAYAIIAHNHPSGSVYPSEYDDISTKKIAISLGIQNVRLQDHLIIGDNSFFSYRSEGRMDEIWTTINCAIGEPI